MEQMESNGGTQPMVWVVIVAVMILVVAPTAQRFHMFQEG